jgi:hypothetical protein
VWLTCGVLTEAAARWVLVLHTALGVAAGSARWFDIKEHWIALGILASLGLVLVLGFWDPRAGGRELVPVVFGLAVIVAGTVWLGAVIGVATASWRAV